MREYRREGGGSLSAFVNMCLRFRHLHKARRAPICCVARRGDAGPSSQSLPHICKT